MILAGAWLLALSVTVAIIVGPWAANWVLAAGFLGGGATLAHLWFTRRHEALFALALGFAALGAATAFRVLGGTNGVLLGILYGVAGLGTIRAFLLTRAAPH